MLYSLYTLDISNGTYYRFQNLVNYNLALAIFFEDGVLCSLKMAHWYQNMLQIGKELLTSGLLRSV